MKVKCIPEILLAVWKRLVYDATKRRKRNGFLVSICWRHKKITVCNKEPNKKIIPNYVKKNSATPPHLVHVDEPLFHEQILCTHYVCTHNFSSLHFSTNSPSPCFSFKLGFQPCFSCRTNRSALLESFRKILPKDECFRPCLTSKILKKDSRTGNIERNERHQLRIRKQANCHFHYEVIKRATKILLLSQFMCCDIRYTESLDFDSLSSKQFRRILQIPWFFVIVKFHRRWTVDLLRIFFIISYSTSSTVLRYNLKNGLFCISGVETIYHAQ